jgi:hypothetical protein
MKKCKKCGNTLIFQGGYSICSMKVEEWSCYKCDITYEKIESNNLTGVTISEKI